MRAGTPRTPNLATRGVRSGEGKGEPVLWKRFREGCIYLFICWVRGTRRGGRDLDPNLVRKGPGSGRGVAVGAVGRRKGWRVGGLLASFCTIGALVFAALVLPASSGAVRRAPRGQVPGQGVCACGDGETFPAGLGRIELL